MQGQCSSNLPIAEIGRLAASPKKGSGRKIGTGSVDGSGKTKRKSHKCQMTRRVCSELFLFNRVVLCLDNDAAGQTAARKIRMQLRRRFAEKFEVKGGVPSEKTFNDQRCFQLQNESKPPSRGTRESTLVC